MVKDIYPGDADSIPILGPSLNGKLLFTANDGINGSTSAGLGTNLWQTDGTAAGTSLLFNFNADSSRTLYSFVGSAGSYVYLCVLNSSKSYELWRTDGTSSGTIMLSGYSTSSSFIAYNGKAFYTIQFTNTLYILYSTDGSVAGITSIAASGLVRLTAILNGVIYGIGYDSLSREELWRTDGTAAGTYQVNDVNLSEDASSLAGLTVVGNRLFFIAQRSGSGSYDDTLFASDGTASGTTIISAIPNSLYPYGAAVGSNHFFDAGNQLWISDGTTVGTHVVVTQTSIGINGGDPGNFAVLNGVLLFWSYDSSSLYNHRLYRSDGTAAGTYPLGNVDPEWSGFPSENTWTITGGVCYFPTASPSIAGFYRTDGTAAGTYLVDSVVPGATSSNSI